VVLRVTDASRSAAWYGRLGYEVEWEHRFEPGFPLFMSIALDGEARIFLSEHDGDATPDSLVHLRVADVDAVAAEFASPVLDQPWSREVHLVDPDGNRLRVGAFSP
jgi:catechol 2,3-dioxygenase-like lactoylglutathione lyase family enzyme